MYPKFLRFHTHKDDKHTKIVLKKTLDFLFYHTLH